MSWKIIIQIITLIITSYSGLFPHYEVSKRTTIKHWDYDAIAVDPGTKRSWFLGVFISMDVKQKKNLQ